MHIYIWTGVLLFAVLIPYCDGSIHYYNLVNVLVFVTYSIVLLSAIGRDEGYYSYGRLGATVFIYSIIFVGMYLEMSYFYAGDTYYWDYTDPYHYSCVDQKLYDYEISFLDQPEWISRNRGWTFTDWGASMSQSLFLYFIPSRYFLFISQTVVGTVGAMLMFSLGKKIMQIDYAYMAALSYSISSFSIFYYSSFRKEIFMVIIVIVSFWFFYKYVSSHNKLFILPSIFITTIMCFFRPAVAGLMLMGFFSYFIGKRINKNNAPYIIFLLLMIIGLSFSVIISKLNSFSEELAHNENYVDTTTFGIVVSSVGVLIGPFPQLLQKGQSNLSYIPLYGSGLLFKYILFLAFWNGFVACLKKQEASVFPLFFFTILEMTALAVMNDGLELRKAMPHICIFYLAAFWFVSKYDEWSAVKERYQRLYPLTSVKPQRIMFGLAVLVFLSTFVWNTMRIK